MLFVKLSTRPSYSPFHFDFSLLDYGVAIASGCTILIPNRREALFPRHTMSYLVENRPDYFSSVPSLWLHCLRYWNDRQLKEFSFLRSIHFAGEGFPRNQLRRLISALPKTEFVNIYGQSESIACSFHRITSHDLSKDHLPVGSGHPSVQMLLIDEKGNQVDKAFEIGELYLKGGILFDGYWRDPITSERVLKMLDEPFGSLKPFFKTGDLCYFDEEGLFYYLCKTS